MKRTVELNDDVTISVSDIMYVERLIENGKPAIKMYMHGIPAAFLYTFNSTESRDRTFRDIVLSMEDFNFYCNCNIHGMVSTEPE